MSSFYVLTHRVPLCFSVMENAKIAIIRPSKRFFFFFAKMNLKSSLSPSQEELENRVHAITDNLIQKQTLIERLSTEKNSLSLQLERLEVCFFLHM